MRKSYIILAHANAEQLYRLVQRLDDGHSAFYIHVDKKAGDWSALYDWHAHNVRMLDERYDCIWGDISIVNATLACIRLVLASEREGTVILLSGNDYPLVCNAAIDHYLTTSEGSAYFDTMPADEFWPDQHVYRLQHYRINMSSKRGDYLVLAPWVDNTPLRVAYLAWHCIKRGKLRTLAQFYKMLRRRRQPPYRPFGGSQWWACEYGVLRSMYEFVEANMEFLRYHRHTHAPDEVFFNTIIHFLYHDDASNLRPSLTYANWTRKGCALPVVFRDDDYDELKNVVSEGRLFARKIVYPDSCSLIARLDAQCLYGEPHECVTYLGRH